TDAALREGDVDGLRGYSDEIDHSFDLGSINFPRPNRSFAQRVPVVTDICIRLFLRMQWAPLCGQSPMSDHWNADRRNLGTVIDKARNPHLRMLAPEAG